ncbi:Leishmanolysin [Ancylostoma caninum]|uniref:Leishmanolysin-like peptidase n=1 Tax=Ancylostoma caninum TaxID=29170 RepID=A0A368FHN9_ANCCA|nr:Leishmanolysin [Ancylostoma caninum]
MCPCVMSKTDTFQPPSDENVTIAITEYPSDVQRAKRDTPYWDWIRIEVEYDETFTSSCKFGAPQYVKGVTHCEFDCAKRCGTATAPPHADYFSPCICTQGDCLTEDANWGGKLHNADFVLFVSLDGDECGNSTLAFASHCSLDRLTKSSPPLKVSLFRPVAGYVNICPHLFNKIKVNELSQWEATIKHELIHAFVFSTTLYARYKPAKGRARRVGSVVLVPGVIEKVKRPNWETAYGKVAHEVVMMVTPKVREEARNFFNCPDLEGAEIESQGGLGTAGSHWEKRVFENEAMTGVTTQVYALSRLTLALFEDSGWYKVNYDKAEEMKWGQGLGCKFAKQSCLTWMKANIKDPYPYCNVLGDTRCTDNRRAKVRCNLVSGSKQLPSTYDYNIKNLFWDKKGRSIRGYGHVSVADYCPYYRIYGDVSKEDTDTRCTFAGNMNYNNYSLEIFSPSARCFELDGDGGIAIRNEHGTNTWLHSVGCFETVCEKNLLYIKTQRSKFYPCHRKGQLIHVEKV